MMLWIDARIRQGGAKDVLFVTDPRRLDYGAHFAILEKEQSSKVRANGLGRVNVQSKLCHLCIIPDFLLQCTRGSVLCHFAHALTGPPPIRPITVAVGVRGAYDFAQACAPSLGWKMLGMRIPGPLALQYDL